MNNTHTHTIEPKKLDGQEHILYDPIYIQFKNKQN